MQVNVIGVDPGGRTGIVRYSSIRGVMTYEMTAMDAVDWMTSYVMTWTKMPQPIPRLYIACERFIIGRKTTRATRQPDAVQVASAIEHVCRPHSMVEFVYQSASDAKMIKNDALRVSGFWTPKGDHANDAARHVMLFLLSRFPQVYNNLLTHDNMNA